MLCNNSLASSLEQHLFCPLPPPPPPTLPPPTNSLCRILRAHVTTRDKGMCWWLHVKAVAPLFAIAQPNKWPDLQE